MDVDVLGREGIEVLGVMALRGRVERCRSRVKGRSVVEIVYGAYCFNLIFVRKKDSLAGLYVVGKVSKRITLFS